MKRSIVALLILLLPPPSARANTTPDLLAQGKVEADLGHYDEATRAFTAVSSAGDATPAQRAEALVRLGAARRAAGDAAGAVDAFERASTDPGLDRASKALLVEA